MPLALILLFGIFLPRLAIFALWAFTSWFESVWQTAIVPLLGFFIMPYITLAYSVFINWYDGVWAGEAIIIMVAAILFDIGQKKIFHSS